jgi:hypothetical protein
MTITRPSPLRTALALLVTSAATAALLLAGLEFWLALHGSAPEDNIAAILSITFVVMLVASVAIGIPIHVVAMGLRLRGLWFYGLCAGLSGTALAFALLDKILSTCCSMSAWTLELRVETVASGSLLGIIASAIFWLIRRPDRDAAPNPPTSAP